MFRAWRRRAQVASLCLVAQLFAVVHLFALHHVRCAEHGDLLHIEGGKQRGARVLLAPTRDGVAVLAASGLPISGHQGDHCTSLTERRDLPSTDVEMPRDLPRLVNAKTAAWTPPAYSARPLYRLAPKISPPAAA